MGPAADHPNKTDGLIGAGADADPLTLGKVGHEAADEATLAAGTPDVVITPAPALGQNAASTAGARPAPRPLSHAPLIEVPLAVAPVAPNRRAAVLFATGLAAVAVAYALAPGERAGGLVEAVAPVRGGPAAVGAAKSGATPALAPPRREPLTAQAAADPFVGTSFAPPPPPPPPPAPVVVAPPPPAPTAPPLPYSFVGMLEKGPGKPAAFIARGDALLVVSAGDVIDGNYRVDVLNPREIVLTYLPLNQRQSLNLSGKNP